MAIQHKSPAYERFLSFQHENTGKSLAQIEQDFPPAVFEWQVRALHARWMSGEFSFGRFTELIGVPHWELWDILDAMGLALHR